MQGKKTREQLRRALERKPDRPRPDGVDRHSERSHGRTPRDSDARQSEMAVSRHGMNQEDRQHNAETRR